MLAYASESMPFSVRYTIVIISLSVSVVAHPEDGLVDKLGRVGLGPLEHLHGHEGSVVLVRRQTHAV